MDLKKLSRLQQEMKEVPIIIAYVSNAITYTQPGFVSMQNWYWRKTFVTIIVYNFRYSSRYKFLSIKLLG